MATNCIVHTERQGDVTVANPDPAIIRIIDPTPVWTYRQYGRIHTSDELMYRVELDALDGPWDGVVSRRGLRASGYFARAGQSLSSMLHAIPARVPADLRIFERYSDGRSCLASTAEVKALEKIIGAPHETWLVFMKDGNEYFTQTQHIVQAYGVPICPTTPPRWPTMVGRGNYKHVSEIWRTKDNWEYGIAGDPYERT